MRKQLEELAEGLFDAAKLMVEGGTELCPMFFLDGPRPQIIQCPWKDNDEKAGYALAIRTYLAAEASFTGYVFISEAWRIKRKFDEPLEAPSQAKDRAEIISVLVADRDGSVDGWSADITTVNGKRIVSKLSKGKYDVTGGDLACLFSPLNDNKPN
jgi:hypothetical protein